MEVQLNFFERSDKQPSNSTREINRSGSVIPGLRYIPSFISETEHQDIWSAVCSRPWLSDLRRRVQHYGWKYDYRARAINYDMFLGPLPYWADVIASRIFREGLMSEKPDQVIVNEYLPGQGIANHVDCEPCFGDTVISLSLGSSCIMDFSSSVYFERKEALLLETRSLVVISGESRYKWAHGIASRKTDIIGGIKFERGVRISLTFRKVKLTCENPNIVPRP